MCAVPVHPSPIQHSRKGSSREQTVAAMEQTAQCNLAAETSARPQAAAHCAPKATWTRCTPPMGVQRTTALAPAPQPPVTPPAKEQAASTDRELLEPLGRVILGLPLGLHLACLQRLPVQPLKPLVLLDVPRTSAEHAQSPRWLPLQQARHQVLQQKASEVLQIILRHAQLLQHSTTAWTQLGLSRQNIRSYEQGQLARYGLLSSLASHCGN